MEKFQRLHQFIESLREDVYPEPPAEPHVSITRQMVEKIVSLEGVEAGDKVLDVGCGQGMAIELFGSAGLTATGITLGKDYEICKEKGLNVYEMDQSYLEFGDEEFDIVWCRHALEHSPFPLFVLKEFHRVIKKSGLIYVEVPTPDTPCHHQDNPNHYSVFGKSMWMSLFQKAGLDIFEKFDIDFEVPAGPDIYWGFLMRRPM